MSPERTKSNNEFGEAEKIDEVVGVEFEGKLKVETVFSEMDKTIHEGGRAAYSSGLCSQLSLDFSERSEAGLRSVR